MTAHLSKSERNNESHSEITLWPLKPLLEPSTWEMREIVPDFVMDKDSKNLDFVKANCGSEWFRQKLKKGTILLPLVFNCQN